MTTTDAYHYRGYEIVPTRQWASWCASIYPMRADLPLISRSTLAPRKEKAVAEVGTIGVGEHVLFQARELK
jgi:hypothetical protein